MAEINESLKRAERAVGLSAAAQRGCLLPAALVAVGTVAFLLR